MGSISPEEAGRPCRLAILECGKPPVDARARYGTYGGMFKALFIQNPNMGTGSFIAQTHYVYEDKPTYPKLSEIDALLITGSSKLNQYTGGRKFNFEDRKVIEIRDHYS